MSTYKLGNKVTAVIRAYTSGKIGNMDMDYGNEPYTILKSVNANLVFTDFDSVAKNRFNQLVYNDSKLSQVQISGVVINDKILNLIFSKSEVKMFTKIENRTSDVDKKIYLNTTATTIYQVFIYGPDGKLDKALATCNPANPITVSTAGDNYLICYQYEGAKGFALDAPDNQYFTVDLMITGNKEDQTSNTTIHIEKCGLRVDRNMYFNQHSNGIDLVFNVVETGEDFIALE